MLTLLYFADHCDDPTCPHFYDGSSARRAIKPGFVPDLLEQTYGKAKADEIRNRNTTQDWLDALEKSFKTIR